nr:hypothetical protein [Tanacetum cinerariifolium]
GVGAVHERSAQRQVATADFHARGVGWNQREADAQILFFAQQMLRVVRLEGQAEQGRDRRQVAAAGRQFHRDLRVGVRRETFAAIFLRNDQGEETVFLDVRPGLGRQRGVTIDARARAICPPFRWRSRSPSSWRAVYAVVVDRGSGDRRGLAGPSACRPLPCAGHRGGVSVGDGGVQSCSRLDDHPVGTLVGRGTAIGLA